MGRLTWGWGLNRCLDWRLRATTSVVCSGLREAVARSSELPGPGGLAYIPFRTLRPAVPSVKVGYGMENIFKVLRGDFVHRLTYRAAENGQAELGQARFVVKLSGAVKR